MPTDIKCPNCGQSFPMEEAMAEEYKKELRDKMTGFIREKEKDFSRREQELLQQSRDQQAGFSRREQELLRQAQERELAFTSQLEKEKAGWQKAMEENLRRSIVHEYDNKIQLLEQSNRDNEERLKGARQRELEFLKKEQEIKNKEAELEITLQHRLQDERVRLANEIRLLEEQKIAARETEHQLRFKELEKQLEDQKKLVEEQQKINEEMRRKAEQGSMQLQGEVQELALEELLRATFPFDQIGPVAKGVRGADCLQLVRNNFGQECGSIIYESKRTQSFGQDWVEKLKADMRSQGATIAVIVTQAMPKDMDRFGEKNGVWICTFAEVKALAHVLRDGILRIAAATRSQQGKGDKMTLLYDYLTSPEFSEQWKAIREGFLSMRQSIQKERDMMEKIWKSREKQLEKVLLNASHVRGSIEGIAGKDAIDVNLLEDEPDDDLLPG